ncbi:hypothetical protein ACFXGT_28970 [Streptomyces sp. NPDC059352]|uniref:hypothetical protein n=1 Tax=Streptomyces sp. NPDC059352 TaxID=3346810 RepID=UPI0036C2554D
MPEVIGAIRDKWLALGGEGGVLGQPLDVERPTFDTVGRAEEFQAGTISWHPDLGAFAVWGAIRDVWMQNGREQFGYPVTDESGCPDGRGRFNHFRAMHLPGNPEASIYWTPETGAHPVYGDIRRKWSELGWERSPLGYPLTGETDPSVGGGRRQGFEAGLAVWHPAHGTFVVYGAIGAEWQRLGGEQFGYPVTDESGCPDGRGRFNHFRAMHLPGNPDTSIYWTPETGARPVYGDIRRKWSELGWETSPLGYPVVEETDGSVGGGRRQGFEAGLAVWHPAHGTFVVYGAIGAEWQRLGGEQFGYPVTDESGCPDGRGRFNHFRAMHLPGNPDASIYWTPDTGAQPVYGAIRDRWARRGWEKSEVGYPIEPEHDRAGAPGREQNFERGRVVWTAERGAFFDPLVLNAPIISGGLAALGGSVTVTVNGDGSTRWQGHAHDSGLDGYEFGISAMVRSSSGKALAFAHSGHVSGAFGSGSPNDDWDESHPPQLLVAANLGAFNDGQLQTNLGYSSDIGSTLESAIDWLIKWEVGTALGPLGAIVFVGLEVGSLISEGSLVPGARLAEGILWMAGPVNTLFAIAAEGVASLGSRTRELTEEEYNWAGEKVFSGSLPPRDEIVLTDTIGGGDNAFVFPRYDGKITLNMGAAAFDDPRRYPGVPGEVFIHELVHAWQLHHTSMDLSLMADAFATKVCKATGGDPYEYGAVGPAFDDFNLEQQGKIVQDWFAGRAPAGTPGTPCDMNSPYFRYINENIRTGSL